MATSETADGVVPPHVRRLLRVEVRRLGALAGRSRHLPAMLNLGALGSARLVIPADGLDCDLKPGLDQGLATDIVVRSLERLGFPEGGAEKPHAWLTRAGALVASDRDLLWHAAAVSGLATCGASTAAAFFVVTRHGWLEVGSGEQMSWTRIRGRWQPPHGADRTLPRVPDVVEGWPMRF